MAWYWTMIGAFVESAEWLGLALQATEGIDHPGRIWAKAARAISNVDSDIFTPNLEYADFQASLGVLFEELHSAGPPPTPALGVLKPMLAFFSGNEQRAEAITEQILHSDDGWVRAAARMGRAGFAENEGQLVEMRGDIDAAYADFMQIGDRWGLSSTLTARGNVRAMDGDHAGAIDDYERALRYAGELGSTDDDSFIQLRLAGLRLRNGDIAAARATVERVRADITNRSQGLERGLYVDGMLMTIALRAGDLEQATAMAAGLRERLAAGPRTLMHGHMASLVGTMAAMVAIATGDLGLAMQDLTIAYPLAVGTQDLPIVSNVGVATAALAHALGRSTDAAEVLGAAARLRGSDDPFDPPIADIAGALRARLGEDFGEIYSGGKSLDRAAAIARLDPALVSALPAAG
jgi:tetratricopeptide (TPR) repeat protein